MASLYPWVAAPPLFPIYLVSLCVHVRVRVCVCMCCQSPLFLSPPTSPCSAVPSLLLCLLPHLSQLPATVSRAVSVISQPPGHLSCMLRPASLKPKPYFLGEWQKGALWGTGVHPAYGPHCKGSCRRRGQGAGNGPRSGPSPSVGTAQHLLPLTTLLQQALRPIRMREGQGPSSSQACKPLGPSSQHGLRLELAYPLGDLGQAVSHLRVSASPTTEQGREESLLLSVPLRTG